MALVTVQRSPSPSNSPENTESDGGATGEDERSPLRQRSFSESYFAVKGTALILPQSECTRKVTSRSHGGDIQRHLQSMLHLLRPQDTLKVAVKLESAYPKRNRYMAVVSCWGRQDTEECVILGIDCNSDRATIGLVLPIWANTQILLDGDGGFSINYEETHHLFKPVSVQAMWSALQSLHKVVAVATSNHYFPHGLNHTWVGYYQARISSEQPCISEWHLRQDIRQSREAIWATDEDAEQAALKMKVKATLREIMMAVDLEEVTSKFLRVKLEETLGMSLQEHKSYVDEEMLVIMGQMDAATGVFDFLYLGSEWNASNLEELKENKVGYILNVTREIDNFFPGMFTYLNIREYDVEETDLLRYWGKTYKFINKARKAGSKVLVHCKMGISRSASTVIAFIMKDLGWSLDETYKFVKQKRSCIKPNKSFMKQLETYQGILNASRQRSFFKSKSENNLQDTETMLEDLADSDPETEGIFLGPPLHQSRPRSWAPEEDIAATLLSRGVGMRDEGGEYGRYPVFELGGEEADVELSSRSTDSAEMSLPDIPSPKTVKPEDDNVQQFELELNAPSSGGRSGIHNSCRLSPFTSPVGSPSGENVFLPVPDHLVGQSSSWSGPTALFAFKVRDDSSWIKESSPDTEVSTVGPSLAETPVLVQENLKSEPKDANFLAGCHDTDEQQQDSVMCSALNTQPMPTVTSEHVPPQSTTLLGAHEDACKPYMGVQQHYVRESIPWNPGTVKKQLIDFEHRIRNPEGVDSDIAAVVEAPKSSISDAQPQSLDLRVSAGPWLIRPGSAGSEPSHSILQSETVQEAPSFPVVTPDPRDRTVSVYEMEDIPLPVGIVQRTKQEIEEKQRPTPREWIETSFSDLDPIAKPVQRSSSLKVNANKQQSKKLRSSERRKTCTPVLSPCNSPDIGSTVFNLGRGVLKARKELIPMESDSSLSEGLAVQVFKYGNEEVPVELGKVRRQAKGFESLKQEATVVSSNEEVEGAELDCEVASKSTVSITQAGQALSKSSNIEDDKQAVFTPLLKDSMTSASENSLDGSKETSLQTSPKESSSGFGKGFCQSASEAFDFVRHSSEVSSINTHPSKSQASFPLKQPKESRLDKETLFLIREIGSALLNQPVKSEEDESESSISTVKQIVKNIEHKTEIKTKSFIDRIVIVEKETPTDTPQFPLQHQVLKEVNSSPVHKDVEEKASETLPSSIICSSNNSAPAMKPTSLPLSKDSGADSSEISNAGIGAIGSPCDESPIDGLETIEDDLVKNLVGKFEIKESRDEVMKSNADTVKDSNISSVSSECTESTSVSLQHSFIHSTQQAVGGPVQKSSSLEDLWTLHRVSDAENAVLETEVEDMSCQEKLEINPNPTSDTKTEEQVIMRGASPRARPSSVVITSTHTLGTLKSSAPHSRRSVHCLSSLTSGPSDPHQFLPSDTGHGFSLDGRKVRKLEGKTHPLAKLGWQHSTM